MHNMDILLYSIACRSLKFYAGVVVEIAFELISNDDSSDITFSLFCNSQYGEPGNRAVWTRDGILLDNVGSLNIVNASMSSYINVLMVRGRTPGTYMCQIRGSDDQLLNSATFIVQGMFKIDDYFLIKTLQ